MSESQTVLELTIIGTNGPVGSPIFTSPEKISIGRDPRAMVHLDHASVSLRHAVVSLEGEGVSISDLGSRTGTWVNGKAIASSQVLRPSDEINIGPFRIRQTLHRSQLAPTHGAAGARALAPPTPFDAHFPATAIAQGLKPAKAANPATARAREAREAEEEVTAVATVLRAPREGSSPDELTRQVPSRARPAADDLDALLDESFATDLAPRGAIDRPVDADRAAPGTDLRRIDLLLAEALGGDAPPQPAPARAAARPQATARSPVAPPEKAREARAKPVVVPVERLSPPAGVAPRGQTPNPAERPAEAKVGAASNEGVGRAPAPEGRPARPSPRIEPSERPTLADASDSDVLAHAPGADGDDDDDDDDDRDFVPPFDLLEVLARGMASSEVPRTSLAVEVARFRDGHVTSIQHVAMGQKLRVVEVAAPLGELRRDGTAALDPTACGSFTIREGGRLLTDAERDARAERGSIPLEPGMEVVVEVGGGDSLAIHLVARTPALHASRPALRPLVDRVLQGAFSIGVHLLVVVVIGLTVFSGKSSEAADINAGRFAQIKIKEVEIEPPPPPPPEPVQVDSAITQPTPSQPMPLTKHSNKAPTTDKPDPQQKAAEPSDSAQKILKALGGAAPAGPDLGALSNLDAMPSAGATTGFKVSDSVGKAPGDTLRLGGGGGSSEVNTKSASESGSNVGRLQVQSTGNVVRARVSAVPSAARVEGQLDRGEIQKVVNAHLAQVQGCYERQLVKNPSLAGKVSFRWVISPTGSVASVRVAQSSIPSTDVMTCIQTAIGQWTFPAPRGGSVTVTYPFAFSSFGN